MKDASQEYKGMVEANEWHDRSEIDHFVEVIKYLSEKPTYTEDRRDYAPGSNRWSWARNPSCKYIEFRFDMRDGGFILLAHSSHHQPPERISLEQLQWQYQSEREKAEQSPTATLPDGKGIIK